MNSLTRYHNNGLELFIDKTTGESFASISGYARMVGLNKATIYKRIARNEGVGKNELKNVEINTPGGIQGVALINESTICKWLIEKKIAIAP